MFALTSSLCWATIVALLIGVWTYFKTPATFKSSSKQKQQDKAQSVKERNFRRAFWVGFSAFLTVLAIVWASKYNQVEMCGYLGGYWYMVWAVACALVVTAGANAIAMFDERSYCYERQCNNEPNTESIWEEQMRPADGFWQHVAAFCSPAFHVRLYFAASVRGQMLITAALLVVLLGIGYEITDFANTAGPGNHQRMAAFGNIEEQPANAKALNVPNMNADDMLVQTLDTAFNKAQASLGDLASRYQVVKEDGVQQTVADRNYFVFPIELKSCTEQLGWGAPKVDFSPGFIAVAADGSDDVKKVTDQHLQYVPGSCFDKDPARHVYAAGFTHGSLKDSTMEIDDNWKAWVTMTFTQPVWITGGDRAVKVLLVDATDGSIQAYDVDKTPHFVDRVISEEMSKEAVQYYGLYHRYSGWMNWTGYEQYQLDYSTLVYNTKSSSIFMMMMTASGANKTSTSVILNSTQQQTGTEFTGLKGLSLTENVKSAFKSHDASTARWEVGGLQLYRIRDTWTWMCIYTAETAGQGHTVAGIGFLDANNVDGKNVRYATSKEEALQAYYGYVDELQKQGANATQSSTPAHVSGTIYRVHPELLNGTNVYTVVLNESKFAFYVPSGVPITPVGMLADMEAGDRVEFDYAEPTKPATDERHVTKVVDVTLKNRQICQR